ncbi:sugar ABC transporter permease [Bowdeniella nasicola]|uniref:Sugar ABC transporter permease n=1 Tax=Bowdeniella nasicola TaxID=208480 RepID=A0A1Q5Q594_9ACTO|nr:carbohydrate ABC transporter permease [Bowdeniella nasicola]OKL54997.1 sugar ABC transporter permease [Bowdeniella nasicola]
MAKNHSKSRATWAANALTYLMLIASVLMVIGPFLLSVMTAVKTPRQFATEPPLTPPNPMTFDNFTQLFSGSHNFVVPIAVTAQVVAVMVIGQMFSSILAAYAFATLEFPGRDALFWVYLATLMVPAVVTIIPLYVMVTQAGMKNTFWGIVVPFMFGSPYAIFLLRENFRSMPTEIMDAARIDGAGILRRLWCIMLPMNKPILATLLLITVVSHWNNFMWPKVIAPKREWNVLTVATASLQTQYSSNWTLVMAATTIALLPLIILFLIFQRQITRSIGLSGLR